jgi:hypothetical protein
MHDDGGLVELFSFCCENFEERHSNNGLVENGRSKWFSGGIAFRKRTRQWLRRFRVALTAL